VYARLADLGYQVAFNPRAAAGQRIAFVKCRIKWEMASDQRVDRSAC
jgi:hypothetical protein